MSSISALATRPVMRLLAAQALAGAALVGLAGLSAAPFAVVAGPGLIAMGLLAAGLSRVFGLGWGWVVLQGLLPPVGWALLAADVPSWVYLLALAGLAGVYTNTVHERVPLYLSNRKTWREISDLIAAHGSTGHFVDLGAGIGGLMGDLARRNPGWHIDGVETAPLVFAAAWLRLKLSGSPATVRFASLWNEDLSRADAVYAFLSPAPMARLLQKAAGEMQPGSVFISNSFWAGPDEGGIAFDEVLELDDERRTRLFIKRF